jgi:urease accessory protein UreE
MLEERVVIDQITVLEDGQIQVRQATKVLRDGVEIAKTFHRHVVAPGDDLAREDARVRAVATTVHTTAVITAFREARAA